MMTHAAQYSARLQNTVLHRLWNLINPLTTLLSWIFVLSLVVQELCGGMALKPWRVGCRCSLSVAIECLFPDQTLKSENFWRKGYAVRSLDYALSTVTEDGYLGRKNIFWGARNQKPPDCSAGYRLEVRRNLVRIVNIVILYL